MPINSGYGSGMNACRSGSIAGTSSAVQVLTGALAGESVRMQSGSTGTARLAPSGHGPAVLRSPVGSRPSANMYVAPSGPLTVS